MKECKSLILPSTYTEVTDAEADRIDGGQDPKRDPYAEFSETRGIMVGSSAFTPVEMLNVMTGAFCVSALAGAAPVAISWASKAGPAMVGAVNTAAAAVSDAAQRATAAVQNFFVRTPPRVEPPPIRIPPAPPPRPCKLWPTITTAADIPRTADSVSAREYTEYFKTMMTHPAAQQAWRRVSAAEQQAWRRVDTAEQIVERRRLFVHSATESRLYFPQQTWVYKK